MHESAENGFQAGADAYDRGRPDYPQEAISYLIHSMKITPASHVADLAADTGKFTGLLLPTGARVTAIEPVEGMRRKFSEVLGRHMSAGESARLALVDGRAEAIPLSDGAVDGLVVAQAFHWFSTPEVLGEIRRVLKPGGRFGLIWNVRDESLPWVARLTQLINRYEGGEARYASGEWKKAFTTASRFSPLILKQFRHVQKCTPQTIVDRVASISFIAKMPVEKQRLVWAEVRKLLDEDAATRGDTIAMPYRTDVYWCLKL